MKRCPQCDRTYEDAKNFCLQDGAPLAPDAPAAPPPPYQPDPFQSAPPPAASAWTQAGSWQQQPTNLSGPPMRKRRVWPWVLGVLGVFVVGGVALVVGVGYFVYKNVNEAKQHIEEAAQEAERGDAPEATAPVAPVDDADVESVISGVLGGGEAGAPTDKDEVLAQLKGIEEEWSRANVEGDKEAIKRILADEYVGTSAGGVTERKSDYVKNLKPSTDIVSPQEFEELSLVLAGGRAILTGVAVVEYKGGRTGRFRFVDIFVWRDGRWQAVTSTTSRLNK